MKTPTSLALIFLFTAWSASAAALSSEQSRVANDDINVQFEQGLLTLAVEQASLLSLLQGIGEQAGFKVLIIPGFEPDPVTVSFEHTELNTAITRLTANVSSIIFYSDLAGSDAPRTPTRVWLLGPGDDNTEMAESNGEDASRQEQSLTDLDQLDSNTRSKAVLKLAGTAGVNDESSINKTPVWVRLAAILASDRDALVRARAAISIGVLQDEEAVYALESALGDVHSSVRAQAINSLGLIGGERAAQILGQLLLGDINNITERELAAQALWRHRSAVARSFLELAANDPLEQIRNAASKPQPVIQQRQTSDGAGTAIAQ
jgi:hypothetical protein